MYNSYFVTRRDNTGRVMYRRIYYDVADELAYSVSVIVDLDAWISDERFHRDVLGIEGANDPKSTHATQNKNSVGNGHF